MRYLYTLLFYMALPFIFLRLLWRSRRAGDYRKRWAERIGFCPYQLQNTIWIHSVSVGETLAAIPLIKALIQRYPHYPIVVTTMTPTGAARVRAAFGDQVKHAYIPYDLPSAVRRFLQRIDPQILVIMETELWPNLLAACHQRDIPVVLANARLSEHSASGYQRIAPLAREMLTELSHLAVQAEEDAARFVALGAPLARVAVTGNIKFDIELPAHLAEKSRALRDFLGKERLIWVAASTHEGEEEFVLAAHQRILKQFPDALLILVPRHPERFDSVTQLVKQRGFQTIRRSQSEACTKDISVYLGDTMGEMMLFLATSDVAFIGGSLVKTGGHNLLEPAVLGKPVISGPHLFNFAAISELLSKAEALSIVPDEEALAESVQRFFAQPTLAQQMGERGRQVVDANRGALDRQLALIYPLIRV